MRQRKIYVVLMRSNTIVSRLIAFFTKDDFTHSAISFDRDLTQMFSFARRYTFNPFIGGFKQERLDEGIYRYHKTLPGAIIELGVTEEQFRKAKGIVQSFIKQKDRYRYNHKGLFCGLFKKPTYSEYKFVCSEFVYYVLYESGIVDFGTHRSLVKPQDFLKLNGKVIFRGDLKSFCLGSDPN